MNMEDGEKMEVLTSGQLLQEKTGVSRDITSREPHERHTCSRNSPGSSTASRMMMEVGLWGALPDEVITTILACLPLPTLLQFRSVCKNWNHLFKDQHFQKTRVRIQGAAQKHQLHLQFLQLLEKSPPFAATEVVSSVGGLLLLTANNRNDVHVIDPLKATLKLIPQPPSLVTRGRQYIGCGMVQIQNIPKCHSGSRYYTVGMVIDPTTQVYNILAVSKGHQGPVSLHLYDSGLEKWQSAGSILPEPFQMRFHAVGVVRHEGSLHCLCVGLNEDLMPKFRVLRYESQQKRWDDLVGTFPSVRYDNRSSPLLFEHRGRLLFAGAQTQVFCIWQYDALLLEWKVIDVMPRVTLPWKTLFGWDGGYGFFSHACGDHLCVGTYDIQKLCLATPGRHHNRRSSTLTTAVLIYNMLDSSWLMLSRPEAETRLVCWGKRRFLYEASSFTDASL